MSDRDPAVRLLHMRDYASKIVSLTTGKKKIDLEKDEIFCLAITRLVELIGEAANKNFLPSLTKSFPQNISKH